MTSENHMTERRARIQRRVPGFDPMKFAREIDREGKKTLAMPVEHKKTWFRLACPNGGAVLNALRVTDQMAIFEARLFADTEDRNPLASFTATRKADKTGQYIRAAQPTLAAEPATASYSADMTVEEICQCMKLEQAKAIKVQDGTCRGWTLEQVAADRPAPRRSTAH